MCGLLREPEAISGNDMSDTVLKIEKVAALKQCILAAAALAISVWGCLLGMSYNHEDAGLVLLVSSLYHVVKLYCEVQNLYALKQVCHA